MHTQRRQFLHSALRVTAAPLLGSSLLPKPAQAQAHWSVDAFTALEMNEAVKLTLGSEIGTPNDAVFVEAPGYIKNTSIVEVTVASNLPEVDAIAVLIRQNPMPLAALYYLPKNAEAFVTTRLDIDNSSDVVAVVRSAGTLYSNYRRIVVTTHRKTDLYDPYDDLINLVEQ